MHFEFIFGILFFFTMYIYILERSSFDIMLMTTLSYFKNMEIQSSSGHYSAIDLNFGGILVNMNTFLKILERYRWKMVPIGDIWERVGVQW